MMPVPVAATTPDAPRHFTLADGAVVTLQRMKRWERFAVAAFVRALPERDRLAQQLDVADEPSANRWIADMEAGDAITVLACRDSQLLAYAGLRRGGAPWTEGLAALNLVALPAVSLELASLLCHDLLSTASDLGMRKVVARLLPGDDRFRAALAELGFRPEAVLIDHVIDSRDRTHDLLIMSLTAPAGERLAVPNAIAVSASEAQTLEATEECDESSPASAEPIPLPAFMTEHEPSLADDVEADPEDDAVEEPAMPLPERIPVAVAAASESDAAEPKGITLALVASAVATVEEVRAQDPPAAPSARPGDESVEDAPGTVSPAPTPRETRTQSPSYTSVPPRSAPPHRRRPRRALAAGAIAVGALLALVSIYLATTTGNSRELDVLSASATPGAGASPTDSVAFTATSGGTGGIIVPITAQVTFVRVAVDRGVSGTWFWCIESSFGLPLGAHYCGDAHTSTLESQKLVDRTIFRLSPRWPTDAVYFVQMYCEHDCSWTVSTSPAP